MKLESRFVLDFQLQWSLNLGQRPFSRGHNLPDRGFSETFTVGSDEGFILSKNRVFLRSPLDRKQCGTGLGEWVVFKSDHVLQIGLTYHMKPYWGIEQWK